MNKFTNILLIILVLLMGFSVYLQFTTLEYVGTTAFMMYNNNK